MGGSLFSDIFSFFGRKWRESDPSFNWIHVICDPKDALNEFPQYLLAQYRSAAESAASVLGIPLNDITPAQVDDYMVDRAVEVGANRHLDDLPGVVQEGQFDAQHEEAGVPGTGA